jgi:hypothetical protein
MQMLNRYFAPFALLLILSAIFFTVDNPWDFRHWDSSYTISLAILAASAVVNWWLSKNTYRFIHWAKQMRQLQIWLTFLWALPLFWLLQPYWAPMWLLFVMAPATAALYTGRGETTVTALVSAGSMLAIYYKRGAFDGGIGPQGGMAITHACFIVALSQFVYGLAQTALRMRDASLPRV